MPPLRPCNLPLIAQREDVMQKGENVKRLKCIYSASPLLCASSFSGCLVMRVWSCHMGPCGVSESQRSRQSRILATTTPYHVQNVRGCMYISACVHVCWGDSACSPLFSLLPSLCLHSSFFVRQIETGKHLTIRTRSHTYSQQKRSRMDWHTLANTLTHLLRTCLSSSPTAASLLDCIQRFCRAALRAVRPSVELAVSSSTPLWWQMTCVSRSDTGSHCGGGVGEGLIV